MSTGSLSAIIPIIEALPTPTLLLNREGTVVKVNQKASDFTQTPREVLEGMKFQKIAGKKFVAHHLQKRSEGEKLVSLKTQKDKAVPVHVSYKSHEDGFIISIVQNDTTAEDSLEQWAAATFHDMNQFLFRVSMRMEQVESALGNLPEKVAEKEFEDMKFNFSSAMAISGAVADMHRIRMGTLRLETAFIEDVAELFKKLVLGFKRQAKDKKIQVVEKAEFNGVSQIVADQHKIDRILSNLVTNAIQHTPEEGVITIKIRANRAEEEKRVRFVLQVKDTGSGIPEKYLEKIFLQGVKVDKSGQGLGIGLANCKSFVQLMDGTISAANRKKHKGANFRAVFFAEEASNSPNSVRKKTLNPEHHKGLRGLIVDDNKFNQAFLKGILKDWHYEFETANNGQEMIEKLQAAHERGTPFEFVICDKMMPGMNGDDATKLWREIEVPFDNHVPIFGFTASISAKEINDCLEAGMDKVFQKTEVSKLKSSIPQAVQEFVVEKRGNPAVAAASHAASHHKRKRELVS